MIVEGTDEAEVCGTMEPRTVKKQPHYPQSEEHFIHRECTRNCRVAKGLFSSKLILIRF